MLTHLRRTTTERERPQRAALALLGALLLTLLLAPGPGLAGEAPGAAPPPPASEPRVCLLPPAPGPPLEAFGTVIWRRRVVLGAGQSACVGDLLYEPGGVIEFGLLTSRYRDRIYLRTDRRILKEWKLPAPGQPDSAVAWATAIVARFARSDTLFVDLNATWAPVVAGGAKARQLNRLFQHWVMRDLSAVDQHEATALGLPAQRFAAPPPEAACPPGGG